MRAVGADRAVAAALRREGVATWAELRCDATRRDVREAVGRRLLVRVGHGRYALPTSPDALRAAMAVDGVVSHASAARLHFLETLTDPDRAHVTVPRRSGARGHGSVRLHWNDLDDDEVSGRVTTPLRTVLDCARTLPFAEALAVTDSALRREAVTQEELHGAVTGSHAKGVRAARAVVAVADGRAANPFESGLRAAVLQAGLRSFRPQLEVATPHLVARVDLGDPVLRMVLEAESHAFHSSRAALDRDCRRYSELVRAGWLVLKFSWEQVMFDRGWIGEVVRDTVDWRSREHQNRQRRATRGPS